MILYVAIGSAIGGVSRYLVGSWLQRFSAFPWGTLAVNVAGSFLLGLVVRQLMLPGGRPELRALIVVGFCGGFTTFSAFSYDAMAMLRDGHWARAAGYIGASVLLSIGAVLAGWSVAGGYRN